MKNKKSLYILLPLVAGLWGYIFYKIFFGINHSDNSDYNPSLISLDTPETPIAYDSVYLNLNYKDPFFRNYTSKSRKSKRIVTPKPKTTSKRKVSRSNVIPPKKVVISWPQITYLGLLSSENNSLGLLKYANKTYYIKNGDIIRDIEIINCLNDSVLIKYKNQKKYIKR